MFGEREVQIDQTTYIFVMVTAVFILYILFIDESGEVPGAVKSPLLLWRLRTVSAGLNTSCLAIFYSLFTFYALLHV